MEANKLNSFQYELENLINRHSVENEWDMPDFMMAEMITTFIVSLGKFSKKNLDWHGTDSVCHPKQEHTPTEPERK